jgi:hypothetical protein
MRRAAPFAARGCRHGVAIMKRRRLWFWGVLATLLAAVTLGGLEALSALVVPPWPARELRPIAVADSSPGYNSWGLRDREHSIGKPEGATRTVLVGDSFLEGPFVGKPVGARIEEAWQSQGRDGREVVSLGISATGPPQYYYRIRDIGLSLQPDAIVLVFFSGNDFVPNALSSWRIAPLIAERPEPSLLGTIAPRLTWLAINRLDLSEFGRGNRSGVDGVGEIIKKPRAERVDAMVQLLKTHYYPQKDQRVMREILARGGDRFWDAFDPRERDEEYLQAWWMASIVDWETGTWTVPLTPEEIEQSVSKAEIASTMSWLLGAQELARQRGIPFLVALAPVPVVDPSYAEFWSPWPRYRSYPMSRDAAHRALRAELETKGVPIVDLREVLVGVRGTYRVSDGHWTELGTELAARRLAAELRKIP